MIARGEYADAYNVLAPICRDNPHDAEALALRGIVYRERGLFAEAEADLKEGLKRDGGMAFAQSAMGILLDVQKRGADAERHHRKAVELEPRNSRYLNNLGFSLFSQGHARDAIPIYVDAARYDPANPRVRNNLGYAYAVVGDWPRARREFENAGSPASARLNLGYAYERSGSLAQAFEMYVEAARLDRASVAARENAVRLGGKLGKPLPRDVVGAGAAAPAGGGT